MTASIVVDSIVSAPSATTVSLVASKSASSDVEFVGGACLFESDVVVSSRNDVVVATELNLTGGLELTADSDCDGSGDLVVTSDGSLDSAYDLAVRSAGVSWSGSLDAAVDSMTFGVCPGVSMGLGGVSSEGSQTFRLTQDEIDSMSTTAELIFESTSGAITVYDLTYSANGLVLNASTSRS